MHLSILKSIMFFLFYIIVYMYGSHAEAQVRTTSGNKKNETVAILGCTLPFILQLTHLTGGLLTNSAL